MKGWFEGLNFEGLDMGGEVGYCLIVNNISSDYFFSKFIEIIVPYPVYASIMQETIGSGCMSASKVENDQSNSDLQDCLY